LREEHAERERDGAALPATDVVFSLCRNGRVKRLGESLNLSFPVDKEDEKGNTLLHLLAVALVDPVERRLRHEHLVGPQHIADRDFIL